MKFSDISKLEVILYLKASLYTCEISKCSTWHTHTMYVKILRWQVTKYIYIHSWLGDQNMIIPSVYSSYIRWQKSPYTSGLKLTLDPPFRWKTSSVNCLWTFVFLPFVICELFRERSARIIVHSYPRVCRVPDITRSKSDFQRTNETLQETLRRGDEDGTERETSPSASIARSKTIHYDYTFRHRLYPLGEQIGQIRRPLDVIYTRLERAVKEMLKTEIPSILIYLVGSLITRPYHEAVAGEGSRKRRRRSGRSGTGTQEGEIWNVNLNRARYPGTF